MTAKKPITKEAILTALNSVSDPQSGAPLTDLATIQGLVLREGHVGFSLEVDPAKGPALEPLRLVAEKTITDLPGVLSVTAVLTAHNEPPAQPPKERPQSRKPQAVQPIALPGIKSIIAVASGKGGVGKSTIAANLSVALARLGLKTGLLDADIYGPSMPRMFGLTGRPETDDGKILKPMEKYGLKIMSMGLMVDEDTAMIWRGPMVQSALTQMLQDVAWGELDVLVIDMPPGTGDAQLTLAQRVPLTGAIVVSTPQEIALADARRGLAMFEKTHVPVLGIVENMAYFVSPGGEKSYIFGQGGARQTAQARGCDFLGEVPLYTSIREQSDAGTPVTIADPDGPEATIFMDLAARVAAKLSSGAGRAAPQIEILDSGE